MMRVWLMLCIGGLALLIVGADRARASDRTEALLARMTLEEKLGQLTQRAGGRSKTPNSRLDGEELSLVRAGRVGSYLHVAGAAPLAELQRTALRESRLGIPLLFAMDVVHGYRTIFPVPLAMAAGWSPATVEQAARIAAVEASAAGLHWTFAPMIDIARDARWGRSVEGAGEDPYLGSVMAAAQVRGFQGRRLSDRDSILATAKHFGAYGAALGGRDYDSADISERSLQEVYLPPFYSAVRAGAGAVMAAFNDVGGVPMTGNRRLLRDVLRDGWGFRGLVVSDWNAIRELIQHGVAAGGPEAGVLALNAGIDVDMVSGTYGPELASRVQGVPALRQALDAAVLRVLDAKERLGLFDQPLQYHDPAREAAVMLSSEHRAAARQAARESIVLLKNEGRLLPLAAGSLESLAVIGALASDGLSPLGPWRAQGREADVITLLDGIRAAVPGVDVRHARGASPRSGDLSEIDEAVRVARSADATVLMIGEDFDLSGEARSRSDIGLPPSQLVLAERVIATGKPVVVVLANGRALAIPWLAERAQAILETWMLGVEAGPAIADILFGRVSPGGKLPVQFPRSSGALPAYYGALPTGRPADPDLAKDTVRYHDQPITPLYPFGHGLSYTEFAFSDLEVSAGSLRRGGALSIEFVVTNRGRAAGDEVPQLYVRDPLASVARPRLQLRAFERIALAPGQSRTVRFTVTPEQFGLYDEQGRWQVEAGEIEFMIGASSADLRLQGRFTIAESYDSAVPASGIETPTTGVGR